MGDSWTAEIAKLLQSRDQITVGDALDFIGIPPAKQTRSDQMRMAQAITQVGWRRRQVRAGDRRQWIYFRECDRQLAELRKPRTRREVQRLAVHACVDERTAAKWLADLPVSNAARTRLEAALVDIQPLVPARAESARPRRDPAPRASGSRTNDAPFRDAIAEVVREVVGEMLPRAATTSVSQHTIEAVRGIPRRIFLEHTRHPDLAPTVLRVGRLRVIDNATYDAFLRRLDRDARPQPSADMDDADRLLVEMGFSVDR